MTLTSYRGDGRTDNNLTAQRFARSNHNKVVDQLAACGWQKVLFRFEYLLTVGPVIWSLTGSVHDQQWSAVMTASGQATDTVLHFPYGTAFDALTDRCIDAAADYLSGQIDDDRRAE